MPGEFNHRACRFVRPRDHVPCSHEVLYFFWSTVMVSMVIPIEASFAVAMNSSISVGSVITLVGSFPLFFTQNSVARACVAKLMSMTLAG